MVNEYRTHSCGELRISDVGKKVTISGFLDTIRDINIYKCIVYLIFTLNTFDSLIFVPITLIAMIALAIAL